MRIWCENSGTVKNYGGLALRQFGRRWLLKDGEWLPPVLSYVSAQSINWRISSRIAISAFASATTARRTTINRLTIRSLLPGVRTPLIALTFACHSDRPGVNRRLFPSGQSTGAAPPVIRPGLLILSCRESGSREEYSPQD